MATISLSRKNLLAILIGLIAVILIGIITNAISFYISSHIVRTTSVQEFKSAFTQQPYITYRWILGTISFVSPIIGGFVVGWIVKDKGWLYGGVLGIILRLISLAFAIVVFLLPTSLIYGPNFPTDFRKAESLQSIINILIYSPITILKTVVGGYLGEHLHKRNRKKK